MGLELTEERGKRLISSNITSYLALSLFSVPLGSWVPLDVHIFSLCLHTISVGIPVVLLLFPITENIQLNFVIKKYPLFYYFSLILNENK